MLVDSTISALLILTYWETYVATLLYLTISFSSILIVGVLFLSENAIFRSLALLGYLIQPAFSAAAMMIFVFTMFPILLGVGDDAAWDFAWLFFTEAPMEFLKFIGNLFFMSLFVTLLPLFGRLHSLQTFVVGGLALVLAMRVVENISFGSSFGNVDVSPGFWFSAGIVALSIIISWLGTIIVSLVLVPLFAFSESLAALIVVPIVAALGLFPIFIYAAWIAAQL